MVILDAEDNLVHSEMRFGDGLIMVGYEWSDDHKSPASLGGKNTQALCVFVDDVDAHAAHTRRAGASIVEGPTTTDYGEEYWADRTYRVQDPEGHQWFFMQRVREPERRGG